MKFESSYLQRVYDGLESRNAEQKEFLQAVAEVLESLEPVVAANPELEMRFIHASGGLRRDGRAAYVHV